ncbi:CheR family methyltransferase [Kamptonema formosum]|uniref:CheR family methyltransferase n=1 Tax=Kamptonema formosum TaxID=331992 RepID=UPI00034D89D1|nr:protein-glutamate O-methyltransferase CheR [Oscillatoria sp. PCC 10802]
MQSAQKKVFLPNEMLQDIEALLRQKIGLEANSIGSSAIDRAVRQRMAECGLPDMPAYLMRLQTSPHELDELVETVIVPETWFFRDREPFNLLSRYVMAEWLPANPGRVLRVLSVPCSTGEEPYSIALALLEAGLTSKNFCIDAADISKKSLIKAQRAVYDRNSFRGESVEAAQSAAQENGYSGRKLSLLAVREKYFVRTAEGYELCEPVRRAVNFSYGNLLDPYFGVDRKHYDVIFCRNLLIYLHSAARKRAIQVLERLLAAKGLLFVGHSETGQLFGTRFVSVRHPMAFAYRKAEVGAGGHSLKAAGGKEKLLSAATPQYPWNSPAPASPLLPIRAQNSTLKTQLSSPAPSPQPAVPSVPPSPAPAVSSMLETARSLANRGQLDEAAALCETYLSQNRVSAEAYLLLGEVRCSAGNPEQAEQYFYKAIYLQPNHEEALTHLALLKERRGDFAGAAILRQRIQRLQKFSIQ